MSTLPLTFTLTTPRLVLRRPLESDVTHIFSATRYAGFNDGMLWEPPEKIEDMKDSISNSLKPWKSGQGYNFSIDERETGEFLGRISIRQEKEIDRWNIGFWTHPVHQGKGIMTEAAGAVIELGFETLGAQEITACHAIWNKASERVLIKVGMRFVEYLEQGFQKRGEWVAENLLMIDKKTFQGLSR
jgi:ribosomal-protein-alanine N-acetyltransferase